MKWGLPTEQCPIYSVWVIAELAVCSLQTRVCVCFFSKECDCKGRKENQILFSKCCTLSQVDPSKQERSIQTTDRCSRRNLSEDGMEQAGREHEEVRHCCSATDFCRVECQPSMKVMGRFPRGTEELAEVVSMLEATGSCWTRRAFQKKAGGKSALQGLNERFLFRSWYFLCFISNSKFSLVEELSYLD